MKNLIINIPNGDDYLHFIKELLDEAFNNLQPESFASLSDKVKGMLDDYEDEERKEE